MNTLEAIRQGDWVTTGLAWNQQRCLEILTRYPGAARNKAKYTSLNGRIPGGVEIDMGDGTGLVIGMGQDGFFNGSGKPNLIGVRELDYNPLACRVVPPCVRDCECEDDWEEVGECDYCEHGCNCDSCSLGENHCLEHDEEHRDYYYLIREI